MVKIQLELTDKEDTIVGINGILTGIKDKRMSIKNIIKEKGELMCGDPDKYLGELGQPEDIGGMKIIQSYSDVVAMGFVIVARRAELFERTFSGQSKIYELVRKESNPLGQIPPEHFVQWDVTNKAIRLIGKNAGISERVGRGPWIFVSR